MSSTLTWLKRGRGAINLCQRDTAYFHLLSIPVCDFKKFFHYFSKPGWQCVSLWFLLLFRDWCSFICSFPQGVKCLQKQTIQQRQLCCALSWSTVFDLLGTSVSYEENIFWLVWFIISFNQHQTSLRENKHDINNLLLKWNFSGYCLL